MWHSKGVVPTPTTMHSQWLVQRQLQCQLSLQAPALLLLLLLLLLVCQRPVCQGLRVCGVTSLWR
jgi:hypothetical protein